MPRKPSPLVGIAFAVLLAGCAHEARPPPPVPLTAAIPDSRPERVSELLAYARRIAVLPPTELQTEYAHAEGAFLRDPRADNRLRLALLMLLPDASFHSPDSALRLLQGYAGRGDASDPLANLSFLLMARAAEQHTARAALDVAAARGEALQRQLDDLRSIERSLNRRPAPRPTP